MSISANTEYTEGSTNRFLVRVKIGETLSTYRELLEYQYATSLDLVAPENQANVEKFKEKLLDTLDEANNKLKRNRDTSLGGNDTINCFQQFNELDDIIPPLNQIFGRTDKGMGRVYGEVFDDQQQILYISCGVPSYKETLSFFSNMLDSNLANLMNEGKWSVIKESLKLVTQVTITVIALPLIAVKWAITFLSNPGLDAPSKYFDFRSTMAMYYKFVNVILSHIAVNMKLTKTVDDTDIGDDGIPSILRDNGTDILTILLRRFRFEDPLLDDMTTNKFIDMVSSDDVSIAGEFAEGLNAGLNESLLYVGFRVEKGTSGNESWGNSVTQSQLAQTMNSSVKASRSKLFAFKGLDESGIGKAISGVMGAVAGIATGTLETMGINGVDELMKGGGIIDFPNIWDDSSFDGNSYDFSFKLRCPNPDPLSIFYRIYPTVALLLPTVLPRSTGNNSYTSPFLTRFHVKGVASSPMALVTKMSMKRGGDEYGWSKDMLPTAIDIDITIQDLSSVMHMPLSNFGIGEMFKPWTNILNGNSNFQDYLGTLGALGVADKTLTARILKRRAQTLLDISANNKFNPNMIGFSLGNSTFGKIASSVWPTKLPN